MSQSPYTYWHLPEYATVRFGKGKVTDIKFSPDGTLLAVATHIGTWLYNAEIGEELSLLRRKYTDTSEKETYGVKTIAFSNDGKSLACGRFNKSIDIWDVSAGELRSYSPKLDDSIDILLFNDDDTKLLSAGGWNWDWGKGSASQWQHDEETIEPVLPVLKQLDADLNVAFSTDSRYFAAVSASVYWGRKKQIPAIQVWDVCSQDCILSIEKQEHNITALTFSPDGKNLAIAEGSKGIQLWDIENKSIKCVLKPEAASETLAFSPDGEYIASGSPHGVVRIWNTNTDIGSTVYRRLLSSIRRSPTHVFYADTEYSQFETLAFSPDSQMVACANTDGTIRCWEIGTKQLKYTITQHINTIRSLTFSQKNPTDKTEQSSDTILTSLYLGNSQVYISEWDIDKGIELTTKLVDNKGDNTSEAALSADAKVFATNDFSLNFSGVVRLWDTQTNELRCLLGGQEKGSFEPEVVFSDDGSLLAVSSRKDNSIQIWDLSSQQTQCRLEGHTTNVYKLAISPDNKFVVSSGWTHKDKTVRLWDAKTGVQLASYSEQGAVAFAPDSKSFAAGCHIYTQKNDNDNFELTVHLEDVSIEHPSSSLIYAPNGAILVSYNRDRNLQLHDPVTGKIISTHSGHSSYVSILAFSSDGSLLASGSGDGTILVWDWNRLISKK